MHGKAPAMGRSNPVSSNPALSLSIVDRLGVSLCWEPVLGAGIVPGQWAVAGRQAGSIG